jgi:NAD(P)-dependent dehydrogenase (short-subunit alcohol dehydrogenase family)
MVQPEEVARLVAHVAHPGALSYTGTIINIDGGMATLRMPA